MGISHAIRRLNYYLRLFGCYGLYLALQAKLSSVPKEVEVNVPGVVHSVRLRLKTSDTDCFEQVFINQEYEVKIAKEPKVIFDAGANVGFASIYFANRFPEARIIAIEPEESNFSLLERNIGPYRNVVAIHAALWDKNTRLGIVDPGTGKWGFQTNEIENRSITVIHHEVQGMTIDQIMQEHGVEYIDVLKMDIEGAEKEVFACSSMWIGRVGILITELHESKKIGCNRSFYNATNDFELEWLSGEHVFLARTGACLEKYG